MPAIEVIRSAKRTKTVQARIVDGQIQVRIPARMSKAEEEKAVGEIVAKLKRRTQSAVSSDADLIERAHKLNKTVLEGRARVESIRWVSNQKGAVGVVHGGDCGDSDFGSFKARAGLCVGCGVGA